MGSEASMEIVKKYARKKWLWSIAALFIVWLLVGMLSGESNQLLFTVKRQPFLIDLKVDGEVRSLNSTVIKAPAKMWRNTRIVKMTPEGTRVKKDDFLIQFDTAEFEQQLREAQNNLEKAQAKLASTIANSKSEISDLESNIKLETYSLEQSRLRAKTAVYESDNKRKEIEFNLKKAEISYKRLIEKKDATGKIQQAAIRQAELEVEQTEIKVQRAQKDLETLTISSPIDGMVVYKEIWGSNGKEKVKVGDTPWRGQALMEIPNAEKMKVAIKINEVDISKLKMEQKVNITLDALPDTSFTGIVKEIATLANRDRKTKKNVFKVEVYINETDERLKPGMSAHCQVIIDELEDVLAVPIDAIHVENEKSWVLDEDGDIMVVETGKTSSDFIIIENGLEDGDEIQLSGQETDVAAPKKSRKKSQSSDGEVFIMM